MTPRTPGDAGAVTASSGRARFLTVLRADLAFHTRRPMFWIWTSTLVLLAWGMSTGQMRIQSGDTSVGGTRAWITSEFAVAKQLAPLTLILYAFFLAIIAGMSIIQDDEWRLGDLLHSTPLKPAEYVWGKFAAVLCCSLAVLAVHLIAMAFFFHLLPSAAAKEIRGPFQVFNYLRPAVVFSLPIIILLSGTALAIGEWGRRAILVFVIPLGLLMVDAFFLWNWSPGWLDPRLNHILMLLDPSGLRWLNETWLKVDRGVSFYNTVAIPYDAGFLISRLALGLLGLGAVVLCQGHLTQTLRGRPARVSPRSFALLPPGSATEVAIHSPLRSLGNLGMTGRPPGLFAGALCVARNELAEIVFSPGLYLFVPLILLQTINSSLLQVGHLDTPLLITSGSFAVAAMSQLATCVCLLLLWYTVESMEREQSTRLVEICYASPVQTGSLLLGKSVALAAVGGTIVLVTGLAGLICILVQGRVSFQLQPFALLWGLLLFPTFLVWTAFVITVQTITRNRYTTYAVALCVFAFTAFRLLTGEINWLGNWPLWDAVRWSDISVLELDRLALVLSRTLVLGTTVFFLVITLRFFRRRETDPTRIVHQIRPRALLATCLRLLPWALVPLVTGCWLGLELGWGREGESAKKQTKDYWRKNVATYRDARVPDLEHVAIDLELFPERGRYRVQGSYNLVNRGAEPLREILLTAGQHWEHLSWTFDDKPHSPIDRARLLLFVPANPLAQGQSARIGFQHEGAIPQGISKRGGGLNEFILPSGVVLTSFGLSIVPVLGYVEDLGIDDENRFESREYPDDFYRGQTNSFVGSRSPFTTRMRITGPADFTMNSVGIKTADAVDGNRRTVVWESDHPVSFYNVIAGRWEVKRGAGTEVYYHRGHPYNVDEIVDCLDNARTFYSDWFFPYPWKELKLSEFPGLATYAQGFPTNISFSEGVGFLTRNSAEIHFAYEITAHEAAHQWWGNIVTPGKGPGGNILSEGMAHFSTILLLEQCKGLASRIDFCKRLEANYANNRHPDSERPLVKIDGSRGGDTTVTYDKGGLVFWMLLNQMGRERALQGLHEFITTYHGNTDHPVLQDFIAVMRGFSADASAFDAFTTEWFHEVVVPEYRLSDPRKARQGETWRVAFRLENVGTGSMPVEVAASRGVRFDTSGKASSEYREARTSALLGKNESRDLTIECSFEPESITVDPDAKVLQLSRKRADMKL
jgi:ABC-type transport system involved in multi-copper enzyme maturation permease subunit